MANGELIQTPVAIASVSTPASGTAAVFPNVYKRWTSKDDAGVVTYHTSPMVNVRDFGAKGDSSTDDTAAINAAIATLVVSQGGTVYFPASANAYKTTGFSIGKGISLLGDGRESSFIYSATASISLVTTTSGAGGGQEISGLQFITSLATQIGVNVKGADHTYIHDCKFLGACDAQIQLDQNNVAGAYTHRVENNYIDCTTTANSIGIRLTNTQGSPSGGIVNTVITRNHILSDKHIVYVNYAGANPGADVIWANQFSPRTNGVGTCIDLAANTLACKIQDNYFEQAANAITIQSGSGVPTPHVIYANHFDSCTVRINNLSSPATVGAHSIAMDAQALLANQAATNATTVLVGATWTSQSSIFSVGSQIRLRMKFVVAKTTSPPTLTFQVKVAGSSQASVVVTQISSVVAGGGWVEGVVTIRTVGAGGTAVATIVGGHSQGLTSGVDTSFSLVNTATFAIDTTATKLFELVGFMTTAVASNTLTIPEGNVEVARV